MNETLDERDTLRKYLLHELGEAEQERLEERLLTDKEFSRHVAMAQNDLIDDFVTGALSKHDLECFRKYFMTTPARLQKVNFATALDRYVTEKTATAERVPTVGAGIVERVLAFSRARSLKIALSVAGCLLIFGIAFFALRPGWFRPVGGQDFGQEFVRINHAQEMGPLQLSELRRSSANTPTLTLRQNLVREDAGSRKVEITAGVTFIRLLLEVTSGLSDSYQAVLQTADGRDIAHVEGLKAREEDGAWFVVVNVPAVPSVRGDYQVRLFRIGDDGRAISAGLYPFQVTTR